MRHNSTAVLGCSIFLLFCLYMFIHLFPSFPGGKNLSHVSKKGTVATRQYKGLYMDYETALEALRNMQTTAVPKMKISGKRPAPFRHWAMLKDKLLYIYNPKCGSSSMKATLKGRQVEMKGFNATGYFTFTMLRNPRDRILSAYSTMVSREKGVAGVCKESGQQYQSPPLPQVNASSDTWREHFVESVSFWMNTIDDMNLESPECEWNSHLIPQVEFFRGFNLSWLGCLEDMNRTFQRMNQQICKSCEPLSASKRNRYEHAQNMPQHKFQTLDLLPASMIQKIDKVYAEDWELYLAVCGYIQDAGNVS